MRLLLSNLPPISRCKKFEVGLERRLVDQVFSVFDWSDQSD
jgi:hypothetical protein